MTPHRRIALGIAIALLVLGTLWWIVRAPAMASHKPAATPPDADVDLDPPALRQRREAARKLATMPDDPWTLAESLAASAPASTADKGRCGDDERPRSGDPDEQGGVVSPAPARAAGPHYQAARASLDAALRASADPFDRAVADWLDVGQMRTPAGRVDALVQQALATGDPRVYGLALRECRRRLATAASCSALSGRRWADLDPGNGVPWIYALEDARQAGDAAAGKEALASLASASRFDDRTFAAAAAIAAHASDDDPGLAALSDLSVEAIGRSVAQMMPMAGLLATCRNGAVGDASRAQQCQAIADTMFEHTDSLILHASAGSLQFALNRDDSRRRAAHAEAMQANKAWSPGTGFSPCQAQRDLLAEVRRKGELGELAALRERLRTPVPP